MFRRSLVPAALAMVLSLVVNRPAHCQYTDPPPTGGSSLQPTAPAPSLNPLWSPLSTQWLDLLSRRSPELLRWRSAERPGIVERAALTRRLKGAWR